MSAGEFAKIRIFKPLKMNETGYRVQNTSLCAPTLPSGLCLPHDPKALAMYPNALGHAGVFSTAEDVARFAQMYLNLGTLDGIRVLKEKTVLKMISLSAHETR
jgi:serine-type D-Ala-D-Ala carboxypeptidase